MIIKDWLPVTVRNRVALGLAALALVIFVTWNSLSVRFLLGYSNTPIDAIAAFKVWPEVFDPENYMRASISPDIQGIMDVTASLAIIPCGLVTLAALPFWKILHATPYICMPLAFANVIGGGGHIWFALFDGLKDLNPNSITLPLLIALNMLVVSAALFTFKNELALREERNRPMAG